METISSSETLCAPLFRCSRTTRKYQNGSVEDFTTRELAAKRAADYIVVGTYERLNHVYPQVDTSKTSLRLWAIARGKRVYALTTDSSLCNIYQAARKFAEVHFYVAGNITSLERLGWRWRLNFGDY